MFMSLVGGSPNFRKSGGLRQFQKFWGDLASGAELKHSGGQSSGTLCVAYDILIYQQYILKCIIHVYYSIISRIPMMQEPQSNNSVQ